MADSCWNIIKELKSLYEEPRVLPKVEKNALLAATLITHIKKQTISSQGYWKILRSLHTVGQHKNQENWIKAQFQLQKKPLDTAFKYIQFFQASVGNSRHQDIKEKVASIVKNWNEIVDIIWAQFPKDEKLKLIVQKEDPIHRFV